ncbi:MAG: hypothetical protein K5831_04510 [Brevundimonas sp.]|uniref:hypothetical protein n=1 Tax=Brevundimonas sp. TaxID=1871086 RepID=UPI002585B295|nr:hypothetical protein [Brevundimonas sp.]MCV0414128.1 hypothetical protein [Brevundimonas sp.]
MPAQRPVSLGTVADEIFDLKLAVAALEAIVASIPQVAAIDAEQPRKHLDQIIEQSRDTVQGDQIARAMFFVQKALKAARDSAPQG